MTEAEKKSHKAIRTIGGRLAFPIIIFLKGGESTLTEVAVATGASLSNAYHAADRLRKAGFLKWRKDGWHSHYSLEADEVRKYIVL
jgi:DNA-binding IclR family transcriptional regulator